MTITKKICLIGDFAVGKTSLIRRYVDRQFSDKYLSTVGVKISRKELSVDLGTVKEPIQLKLVIWDLEGQTKFAAITPGYLQGAGGAIIVGAMDRQDTLENLTHHVQLFQSVNPQGPIIIALNKADLLTPEQQQAIAEHPLVSIQAHRWQLTSAKTGNGVDQLFESLARELLPSV